MIKYRDIIICKSDMDFIKKISKLTWVNYENADIIVIGITVTNAIIYYVYKEHIHNIMKIIFDELHIEVAIEEIMDSCFEFNYSQTRIKNKELLKEYLWENLINKFLLW